MIFILFALIVSCAFSWTEVIVDDKNRPFPETERILYGVTYAELAAHFPGGGTYIPWEGNEELFSGEWSHCGYDIANMIVTTIKTREEKHMGDNLVVMCFERILSNKGLRIYNDDMRVETYPWCHFIKGNDYMGGVKINKVY